MKNPKKPRQKQQGKLVRTNLRQDDLAKLSEIAKKDGRTRSGLVTNVLRQIIQQESMQ